jgi:hypothetical protein
MSKKTSYYNEPLGALEVIADFLPPAGKLQLRESVEQQANSAKGLQVTEQAAARHRAPPKAG